MSQRLKVPQGASESSGSKMMVPGKLGGVAFVQRFTRDRVAVVAVTFLGALVCVAVWYPQLVPHDPSSQSLSNTLQPPLSAGHLLGTDALGRDVFSRLLQGARAGLSGTAVAIGVAMALGVPAGLVAGYRSRYFDLIATRLSDSLQSFPPLVLALCLVATWGPSLRNAMIAVGVALSPVFFRVTRAAVLDVSGMEFVDASRSIGTPLWWILGRRILPNVVPHVMVQVSVAGGVALLSEAALSFLGLGVQPPTASWGSMLSSGYNYMSHQPWLVAIPGLAIGMTALCFNLVGERISESIGHDDRQSR